MVISTYINEGRIENRTLFGVRTHFLQYFSWNRFLFLTTVTGILILTNPANNALPEESPSIISNGYLRSLIFGDTALKATNFLFFSVHVDYSALIFGLLGDSWACRYDDPDIGFLCENLTPLLSHGKPLLVDSSDPVFTAHRIVCWLLILSTFSSFCFSDPPPGRLFDNPFIDSMFSVLYRPNLLYDLFHENLVVYPALQELYRVLPMQRSDSFWLTGNVCVDFGIWTAFVLLFIGGGSNWLASQILPKETYIWGFSPVVAASMAYTHRMAVLGAPTIFDFDDIKMSTTDLYWAELALVFFKGGRRSISQMVVWFVAGVLGTGLAKYHLENLAVFGGVFKYFGLA